MSACNLVIGSTGLVGSAIAQEAGADAICAIVDWRSPQSVSESLQPALSAFFRRGAERGAKLRVFWAAGRTVVSSEPSEIQRELETFEAAIRLMMRHSGAAITVVLVSSAGALFDGFQGPAISEMSQPNPISKYGFMKLAQEQLLTEMCGNFGHRALILRVPTVYGPNQDPSKKQGLISALIRSIRTSSLLSIYVPRDSRRHYVWVHDLARASLVLPAVVAIPEGRSEVRSILTDRSRTIDEVIGTVARVARRRPAVQFMPANFDRAHGHDLSQRTEFPELRRLAPFTGLAEGIMRLLTTGLRQAV